ncbi:MAG: hypothetical protein QXW38_08490 [Candidatus Nitrosotenuis sp.]
MEKEKLDFIKANGKIVKLKVGELVRLETDVSHYYWLDGEYLPGVTSILSEAAPTPYGLRLFWQERSKEESDKIFETDGDFGSKMHDAFEKLLNAERLSKIDYPTVEEQKTLTAFIDWFRQVKPNDFTSEQVVASKKYKYAGTLDFVGKIGGKLWLIDFKTSNAIRWAHQLQVLAYKQAYEESYGLKIDFCGIARFGTKHKGNGKAKEFEGVPQTGKGWEFKPVTDLNIDAFMNVYRTYLNLHGGQIPEPEEIEVYPDEYSLFEEAA